MTIPLPKISTMNYKNHVSLQDIEDDIYNIEILIQTIKEKGCNNSEIAISNKALYSNNIFHKFDIPQFLTLDLLYKLLKYYNNKRDYLLEYIKNNKDLKSFNVDTFLKELSSIDNDDIIKIERKNKINEIFSKE